MCFQSILEIRLFPYVVQFMLVTQFGKAVCSVASMTSGVYPSSKNFQVCYLQFVFRFPGTWVFEADVQASQNILIVLLVLKRQHRDFMPYVE